MGEASGVFEDLLTRVRSKDRRALARLISRMENGDFVDEARARTSPHQMERMLIVGMTGSPARAKVV